VYYGKDIVNRMHQTGSLDIFLEWLGIMNLLVLMYDEKKKRAGGKQQQQQPSRPVMIRVLL
jgi:hypothetical protein